MLPLRSCGLSLAGELMEVLDCQLARLGRLTIGMMLKMH